jgi:hypothetical protein
MTKKNYETPKRCYESHPPLPIGQYLIYGGSCLSPIVTDADIYVGFDHGMRENAKQFPWNEGESFLFPIQDMGVPKNLAEFKKMIHWISLQLIAGKKVHMGCIGGHGRTGLVMAALVKHMTGEVDAIKYVRDNYCQKVVESQQQVDWLNEHFGITKAHATKGGNANWGNNWDNPIPMSRQGKASSVPSKPLTSPTSRQAEDGALSLFPSKNLMSIWGLSFKMTASK